MVYFANFVCSVYEIVSSVLLVSQLKRAVSDLRENFSDFVISHWNLMSAG